MNITELFHNTANHIPSHKAVIDDDGFVTYSELSSSIHDVALQIGSLGIKPGMGVGVLGPNGRNFIINAYAVMQSGAVVLPLSNQLKKNELDEVIQSAGLHA